jgi:hypothetical protein
MENIINFPSDPPEFLIGPFTQYRVMVDGRMIPRLTGYRQGTKVWLVLDGRFGLECADAGVAYCTAAFVANALAIGEGYTHYGADSKQRPFAPLGFEVGNGG